MDKKLEYAKRWFDKARNNLLDADNNLAADKVPYAVEVRYPGDELTLTIDNATEARQATQEVLDWLKSILGHLVE